MNFFQKLATLKFMALVSGVYLFFVLYLMRLPFLRVKNIDLESLDIRWSYTLGDVTTLFNTLGIEGLEQYKKFLIIDAFYPLVYGLLLILGIIYLQQKIGHLGKWIQWMRWLPIVLVLLDYTENINTWLMINSFPYVKDSAVCFGSTITMFKWYLAYICVGLMMCGFLVVILRNTLWKWRNQK